MFTRRVRIAISVLVVASLTFIILDLRGGEGPLSSARAAIASITGGVESGASTVFSPITSASNWWSTLTGQAQQITELRAENETLRSELRIAEADRARLDAFHGIMRISAVGNYQVVPAQVIAVGPAQDFSWTVTIDVGRNDGIEPEMTVINGDGLVGRVLKVFATTSTVVLLVDASSAVGGRVATTEEIGIVSGTGRQDSLDFQMLDPLSEVRVGDGLVTFGSKGGRPYAAGLPIGEVIDVSGTAGQLTRIATVRPYADVSRLSVVAVVVQPPRVDPRDAVIADRGDVAQSAPVAVPSTSPSPEAPADDSTTQTPAEPDEPVIEIEQPATPAPAEP
ncbi:MAG: Cell shape-determining protein MreC precursor [Actinomycetota bacterium]|jgi:rod shape-determining protein MreC